MGGLKRDGLERPECKIAPCPSSLVSPKSEDKKCLRIFSFRTYFCMSTKVENLFSFLGGMYFSPLSKMYFSSTVRADLLRFRMPVPSVSFFFFLFWRRHPPLEPLREVLWVTQRLGRARVVMVIWCPHIIFLIPIAIMVLVIVGVMGTPSHTLPLTLCSPKA